MRTKNNPWRLSRRDFLKQSGLLIGGLTAGLNMGCAGKAGDKQLVRFVMATDAHYADSDPRGERFYRESLPKMSECTALANDKKADFLIELGDFKDQNNPPDEKTTLNNLQNIEKIFRQFKGPRYHVLGNHDADSISKEQFLSGIENTGIAREEKYYSFDKKGTHFIVLDANYNSDGSDYDHGNFDWTDANIPQDELHWLENDLRSAVHPAVVFVHQQLDGSGPHTIKNAAQVRSVLEESKKVLTVFQGHNHQGAYSRINGIHYYTLKAMVTGSGEQNSAYALVEVAQNNDITVSGYRRALSRKMAGSQVHEL